MSSAAPITSVSLGSLEPEDTQSPAHARARAAVWPSAGLEAGAYATIIESISQGLAVYDAEDRLVTCNSRFFDLYPALRDSVSEGLPYETVLRAELDQATGDGPQRSSPAERVSEQLEQHRRGAYAIERRLAGDRWILVTETRGPDGSTVALHTDVTEQRMHEAKLERIQQEMQEFANVASHDLMEPLRKIESFGARLEAKSGHNLGDGREYLDRMLKAAKRMRGLLTDLLTYSRVTTRAQPFVPVELTELVSGVVEELRVPIQEGGVAVHVGKLPALEADPRQLRLLFQNLISNAVKFRRDDATPEVRIDGESDDSAGACRIVVADNGIGFDMKHLERIFTIFQRLHGRSQYEGTGVGLATCRKIVDRHRGTISAESEPGEGARFIVTLPAGPAPQEMIS